MSARDRLPTRNSISRFSLKNTLILVCGNWILSDSHTSALALKVAPPGYSATRRGGDIVSGGEKEVFRVVEPVVERPPRHDA